MKHQIRKGFHRSYQEQKVVTGAKNRTANGNAENSGRGKTQIEQRQQKYMAWGKQIHKLGIERNKNRNSPEITKIIHACRQTVGGTNKAKQTRRTKYKHYEKPETVRRVKIYRDLIIHRVNKISENI